MITSNSIKRSDSDIRVSIRLLEMKHGITAVGSARQEIMRDERKFVASARQGSALGCRMLRLLGWSDDELETLWMIDSDAEMIYTLHHGQIAS